MTGPRPARSRPLARAAALGLMAALLAWPVPAYAHGIGGDAADRSVWGFVPLGIEHMLLGWDHLLFIGGVVLLAREWRRAAKLVTLFVVGHSTTLIVATLAGWRVSAGWVDVVIALSVAVVGAVGVFFDRPHWNRFGVLVLAFGLVHGLGLATRLQDLGLPEDGRLLRVVAFNVGIEIGQLTAILVLVVAAMLVATWLRAEHLKALAAAASVALVVTGAVAAAVLAYGVLAPAEDLASATGASGCTVGERTLPLPGATGGHTEKAFYEPDEPAPLGDFGHSVGDGFVVVLYPPDLAADEVTELRDFVAGPDGQGVLAGASSDAAPQVVALTARTQLTCDELDIGALADFRAEWFESIS